MKPSNARFSRVGDSLPMSDSKDRPTQWAILLRFDLISHNQMSQVVGFSGVYEQKTPVLRESDR
jgi:hypothetical protein